MSNTLKRTARLGFTIKSKVKEKMKAEKLNFGPMRRYSEDFAQKSFDGNRSRRKNLSRKPNQIGAKKSHPTGGLNEYHPETCDIGSGGNP